MTKLIIDERAPFPNNPFFHLRLYQAVFNSRICTAAQFEDLFLNNDWGQSWRNGVFSFHHYHSTAHEVLGCYSGSAEVQMGGPQGEIFTLNRGDAVLIPAGVAHCLIDSHADFHVVGAYPNSTYPDTCREDENQFKSHCGRIRILAKPELDPVTGERC